MASGSFKSAMTGDYGLEVEWESVMNVAANTSTLTMKVYVLYPSINITSREGGYTTIAGSKVEFSTKAIKDEDKGRTLLKTRTEVIPHDTDGTKSVKLVAYFPIYLKSESLGWIYEKKASATINLDNIPRSSQISSQTQAVTVDGKNEWSIAVSRHSEAFYHKAALSIGSYSHVTEGFATTAKYAIPTDWLNAIPNDQRGSVNVSVQTYSDSTCTTAVGDAVTSSFEIVVSASASPAIADGWAAAAPYNAGTAADGLSVYVQGYSRAQVTFDESKVTPMFGAGIASVQVSWDGAAVSAVPYRTKVLSKSGEQFITCTVTDTRGLKSTKELKITVQAYTRPTLSGISIYRCDSAGVASDAGAYIFFKATGAYSGLSGENTMTMKCAYRAVGANAWTESAITSGVQSIVGGSLSSTASYEARITAVDRLGNSAEFNALISTAEVAFHIKPGGRGAAFGKYAEHDNALDLGDWKLIAANFYPVGSVYCCTSGGPPNMEFGWTWAKLNTSDLPFKAYLREK